MKSFLLVLIAAVFATLVSVGNAATLSVQQIDADANFIYAIRLNGLAEADQATALSVSLLPGSAQFLNYDPDGVDGTTPRAGGDNASFTNALLAAPVAFGGKGWGVIDGSPEVPPPSGPAGIGWAASRPGFFLTADNDLLANVVLPKSTVGSALVVLIGGDGNPLPGGELSAVLGIPEPGTLAMGGLSLIGLVLRRRNG